MDELAEHLPFFAHMTSFSYRMRLARERTSRIAAVVAHDQLSAAALQPRSRGRGLRERRLAYWADRVAAHGPLGGI
jgi:hypothetical protein